MSTNDRPKKLTRAERKLAEVDVDKEHKTRPATPSEHRWYEKRLGQQSLPLDEEPCKAAIREGIERRSAEAVANDNARAAT